jgi:hypothetical protein
MLPDTDDAAVQADAYIDALLTGHRRAPVALPAAEARLERQPGVRDAIRLMEHGLPRFHPSFLFEEWLADQLRRKAVGSPSGDQPHHIGQIVPIAVIRRASDTPSSRIPDRRLLVGGAIASGVSIAGAAMFAWRRSRRREWIT